MEFVTFEIAKKLKEKGFKEECLCYYIDKDLFYNIESPIANNQLWFSHNKFDNIWHRDNYDAPTISQVLKWLKKEKNLFVSPSLYKKGYESYIQSTIFEDGKDYTDIWRVKGFYPTYEQAALAGIEYVLDNLI